MITEYNKLIERYLLNPTLKTFSTSPNPIYQACNNSRFYIQRLTVDHKPDGYIELRRILSSNWYVSPFMELMMNDPESYFANGK